MEGRHTLRRASLVAHRTTRAPGLVALAVLCASCGGGSDSAPTPAPQNNPPTISGSPPTQVTQGQPYSFTPVASDADGDQLIFAISNPPAWASFDTATGQLSGTPGTVHVGTTLGVAITVSDGRVSAALPSYDLEVQQILLGSATVSWSQITTNADGTPLTDFDRYRIHYGQAPASYTSFVDINDVSTTQAQINNLTAGTWYFSVTAQDLTGNRSAFSAEVSKVVTP